MTHTALSAKSATQDGGRAESCQVSTGMSPIHTDVVNAVNAMVKYAPSRLERRSSHDRCPVSSHRPENVASGQQNPVPTTANVMTNGTAQV